MKPSPAHRIVALFIVCLCPSIAAAQIPQFDSFYVFGDSLADNGNVLAQTTAMRMKPPVPPSATPHMTYFGGRFSNGYVGFEYLWQRLSGNQPGSHYGLKAFLAAPLLRATGAVDFAFGGTGTPYVDQTPGGFSSPGLKGQIELFRLALLGRKPSPRALYAIATGANDYRNDPFNVPMHPVHVVRNIEQSVESLYRLGARDVIVLDLPDLGLVPANAGDPAATEISLAHNKLLKKAIARLRTHYPDLHLTEVNLDPLFNELRTWMVPAPALAVFAPPTNPNLVACLFIDPATCTDAPAILFNSEFGFLFWDIVHPTTEAHRYLSDYMFQQLSAEYE